MGGLFSVSLPDQEGPRRDDSTAEVVGYGGVINRIQGTERVTCALLQQLPLVETVHEEEVESGGKGGTSSYTNTTYTYSATFAVMAAEGPVKGVRRIWLNSKLFYENRPYQSGDVLETRRRAEALFTFYPGDLNQQPDPILQAANDRQPAYRGRAYIVFNNLQLEEFGNRIPAVEVELIENGTGSTDDVPYPYPLFLREVVGKILADSGMDPARFDVSQLTQKVQGYVTERDDNGLQQLEALGSLYNFYPVDQGDKLVMQRDPSPVIRDEHLTSCIINEDGFVVNAYHDVLGRQGYFPAEAGTSEGQFLMIRGALLAREVLTGDARQDWEDIAFSCVPAIDGIYTQPPPASPGPLYTPHWLFIAKAPVEGQSHKLNQLTEFNLGTDKYIGRLSPNYPEYGDRILSVTGGYSDVASYVSWFNPFAGIIGSDYGEPELVFQEPDGSTVVVFDISQIRDQGLQAFVNLKVIYNFGELLNVSQNIEAWPHWRGLDDGEISCAVDVIPWALESFKLLKAADTGNAAKWQQAIDAQVASVYDVWKVDDGRAWLVPTSGGPLSISGSFVSSFRPGFSESSIDRNQQSQLVFNFPESEGEAQFGRGLTDTIRASDTHIRITYSARMNRGSPVLPSVPADFVEFVGEDYANVVWVFIQQGESPTTGVRHFYPIILPTTGGTVTERTVDIPLSSFQAGRLNDSGWQPQPDTLTPGTAINVAGVIYGGTAGGSFTLDTLRPIPEIALPYTFGVTPFTANSLNGVIIDWRGAPGIGYQDPLMWHELGEDDALDNQLQFLEDSQQEFANRYGTRGPFIPAYVWDRFDRQATDDAPDTWTFNWVDPNSEWIGYTARVVASCAETAFRDSRVRTRAADIAADFLTWFESVWTDENKFIITNLPETIKEIDRGVTFENNEAGTVYNGIVYRADSGGTTGTTAPNFPTTIGATVQDGSVLFRAAGYTYGTVPAFGDYDEPHAAALILRAAAYLHSISRETSAMIRLMRRCWNYLERLWANAYGDVANTWSNNPANGEWFGFWTGEIVTLLARLNGELSFSRNAATIPEADVTERLRLHGQWVKQRIRTIEIEELENVITRAGYSENRTRESELPRRVEMTYPSINRNLQEDVRIVERRSARSENVVSVRAPTALTAPEAVQLATSGMLKAWSQRTEWEFALHSRLFQPGDVKEYRIDGEVRRLQFQEVDETPTGVASIRAVEYNPAAFGVEIIPTSDPRESVGITPLASTVVELLDIPLHDDAFDTLGFVTYGYPTSSNWRGGQLYQSSIRGTRFEAVANYIERPVRGFVSGVIPAKRHGYVDTTTVITVTLNHGELESIDEPLFRRGRNAALCGGEIIWFQDAALVSGTTYQLTTLLRGQRGTVDNINGHEDGETFVLLSGPGIVNAPIDRFEVGLPLFYKGVSTGQNPSEVEEFSRAILGKRNQPLKVSHLRGARLADGVRITWIRQTRVGADLVDWSDARLGEEFEAYTVEILDGPGGAVLNSFNIESSTRILLTNAQIQQIYGSTSATVYASVWQQGSLLGNGVKNEVTIL
jgi:hypothetical protein